MIARHRPPQFLSLTSAECFPSCIGKSHRSLTFGRSDKPAGTHANPRTIPAEAVDYDLASSNCNRVAVRSLFIASKPYLPAVFDAGMPQFSLVRGEEPVL